jgi:hypothetical protein
MSSRYCYLLQDHRKHVECYAKINNLANWCIWLPKEVTKWRPPGRRKRGRPKFTWAEGIRRLMGENGLVEKDWNDRKNWRKKTI